MIGNNDKIVICAALTGMVATSSNNPNLPVSVDHIIADGISCVRAGASILHIHARDEQGMPTYKKEVYARIIEGIRNVYPDVVLCVSTSGRTHTEFTQRSQVLELTGDSKPDMASLTLGSMNFKDSVSNNSTSMIQDLLAKMNDTGIVPELEIFDTNMSYMAKFLVARGLLKKYYANIILGTTFSTEATTRNLVNLMDLLPAGTTWACGAIGKHQLPMNMAAILNGGNVRTGLEDNLFYTYREHASNPQLVERIVNLCSILGKDIASSTHARSLLSI